MPYITKTARQAIDEGGPLQTANELNYIITKELLSNNLDHLGAIQSCIVDYVRYHGLSYGAANDIIGALECARREFKRRRGVDLPFLSSIADKFYDTTVVDYENQKIKQNGDLF